jgi:hypothetical protein
VHALVIQRSAMGEYTDMTTMYRRFASICAIGAALLGVLFTVSFAAYVREGYHWAHWTSAIALTAGGIVTIPVVLALYERLRDPEQQLAVLASIVGLAGALGAAVHGAYDVAVLAKPAGKASAFPSQVDPRGFATFALTALALGLFGWLALRGGQLPRLVAQLALAAATLLVVVYFGRLIALDPNTNVIKVAALAVGLVVSPAFYLGVARSLARDAAPGNT